MHTGYLKGYYGYQNFGDELLLFGVLQHIAQHIPIRKLYIEAGDKARLENRLRKNKQHRHQLPYTIQIVQIHKHTKQMMESSVKIFGGGEVLNDEDSYTVTDHSIKEYILKLASRIFTRSGWNYFIRFFSDIRHRNFYILGGIGKPHKLSTKLLYKILLPRARHIRVRDKESFDIATRYTSHATLINDFSTSILQAFQSSNTMTHQHPRDTSSAKNISAWNQQNSYIVCNISSHVASTVYFDKLMKVSEQYHDSKQLFFPCDMHDDYKLWHKLKMIIPRLKLYNRTEHSLNHSLQILYNASYGIGSRLHFLYPLKIFDVPLQAIVYKHKVHKIINASFPSLSTPI